MSLPSASRIGPLLADAEIPLAQVRYNDGKNSVHTLTFVECDVAEANEPARFACRSITKSFVGTVVLQQSYEYGLGSLTSTKNDCESPCYDTSGFALGEMQGWNGHAGMGLGYQSLAMYNPKSGDSIAILLNAIGSDPDLPAHPFTTIIAELE